MTPYEPNKKRLSRRDVCPYPRQRTQSVCSASCFDCSDVCDQERCRGKCRPCSDAHAADGAFRVRVIDPATGAGLAGAVFELRRGAHAVSRSATDADGRILYANLPDGEYTLVQTEPPHGYALMDVPQMIGVRDGAYTVNGTAAGGLLLPGVSAARIVVSALHEQTGQPVPGCTLSLSPAGESSGAAEHGGTAQAGADDTEAADGGSGFGPDRLAVTDNEGRAAFAGLRPGAYWLRVREAAQGLRALREAVSVLVRGDGAPAEEIALQFSASAALRIVYLDEKKAPKAGLGLRLAGAAGDAAAQTTDEAGKADFRALEAGAYTLAAQETDGAARRYSVTVDGWGLVCVDGVPTRTLRVGAPGPQGAAVRVCGPDGRPLPGVCVQAARDGEPAGEQVTDAWGWAVFCALPPGCTLTKRPPAGFQPPRDAVSAQAGTRAEIALAPLDGTTYADGHIVWADRDNAYRSRPLGMTLNLYCDGALCRQQQVSAAGTGYYRFAGLPRTGPDGKERAYAVRQAFSMPGYRTDARPGLLYNRLQTASVRVSYTDGFTMLDIAGQDAYTVYRGAPLSVRFKSVYGYEPVPPLSFSLAHVTEAEEVTFYYQAAQEAD